MTWLNSAIVPLMPEGVEHEVLNESPIRHKYAIVPLMPEGVEHSLCGAKGNPPICAIVPLMPEGVEHQSLIIWFPVATRKQAIVPLMPEGVEHRRARPVTA